MNNVEKIDIRTAGGGVIIPVKVVPGSSRDRVVGVLGDSLKITTSAPPEKGKANIAIAKTLAEALGVNQKSVTLTSGSTNPRKEFCITGLSLEAVGEKLRGM